MTSQVTATQTRASFSKAENAPLATPSQEECVAGSFRADRQKIVQRRRRRRSRQTILRVARQPTGILVT